MPTGTTVTRKQQLTME